MKHSLSLVEISGTAPQRGRQYGEAVAQQLDAALGYYAEAFGVSTGLTWQQVTARAARWLDPVRKYAPDLLEEMQGIADGAGLDLLDIMALNARGEVIYDDSFNRMPRREEPAEGCTSFTVHGEASGDSHVWAGQNWDWRAGVADTVVMLRIVQPPKPTVIMQVEAGQIGRQGANSAGIALNANGLGGRFDDAVGLPQTVIRRRVLDQSNITEALDVLFRTRAHIASNALLTCREGFAIDVETTPAGHGWLYPNDGLLVHGNHYQAGVPDALAGDYRPISSDSLVRLPRAQEGLRKLREATGPDESRKLIKQAMSDHLGYPESLCTHADPRQPQVKHWKTLVSSCVDLTAGDYHVTAGTPCDRDYQRVPWNLYDGPHSPN
ncbi:C45 family autoproteolytic acyltransferase/hydrolase [Streptomyces sp. NPDC101110]|uniref:C45 family autoproteolytic acyltransferase/hydolase n=1 Tax=unclassified Streptomyces TaxID=2593676 RepID=UPI00383020DE